MEGLETKLNDALVTNAPVKMPENGKKALVEYLPWISLVFGIIQLLLALSLLNWARTVNSFANYASDLCNSFGSTGCDSVATSRFTIWVYVALAVLAIDGILLVLAFSGLKARKKQGWNYLFYAALLNFVYGIVSMFIDGRGGVGSLVWALITTTIGLWIIFQVRSYYTGARAGVKTDTTKPVVPSAPTATPPSTPVA